jgi:UDP-glucuronate 4-epimerase
MKKKILITGCAGFIGYHVTKNFLSNKYYIIGVDNVNNYYSTKLKKERLFNLKSKNFRFHKVSINNKKELTKIFLQNKIDYVFHFAAQAGVRFSIEKPKLYLKNNIEGFLNILELCKNFDVKHLIYASSSSVYGNSKKKLSIFDKTDNQTSFYAVTKKTNELMAKCYFNLYNLQSTGLRFFTVYGPYGRPDMSLHKFVHNIINNKKINLFNRGNHIRSFTYIDDAVDQIKKIFLGILQNRNIKKISVLNISDGKSANLNDYISIIENILQKKSKKKIMPLQMGDVQNTFANINYNKKFYDINKTTDLRLGISNFVSWFKQYYK